MKISSSVVENNYHIKLTSKIIRNLYYLETYTSCRTTKKKKKKIEKVVKLMALRKDKRR